MLLSTAKKNELVTSDCHGFFCYIITKIFLQCKSIRMDYNAG